MTDVVDAIADVICGGEAGVAVLARQTPESLSAIAEEHGVLPLVADRLARRSGSRSSRLDWIERSAAREVAADLMVEIELREVLGALEQQGARVLVMKGSQLAYSHYPQPHLRPRIDTDLLIATADRPVVDTVLRTSGYVSTPPVGGDLVMLQRIYAKDRPGVRCQVDVHWRLANPAVFADVLTFDEADAEAVALPALSASARGLCDRHALLVACVHRVAHHYDDGCLIWLYDIHLIASRLTASDWDRFTCMAASRGVAAVCRVSLERAIHRFRTPVPDRVLDHGPLAVDTGEEVTARYLRPGRRPIEAVVDDLRSLRAWPERWRLIREHAFPSAAYMRDVYAPASVAPLPVLYARRVFRGVRKWLEHQ